MTIRPPRRIIRPPHLHPDDRVTVMSSRAVRCLLINLGLHALMLGLAAPFMIRVIRADGGTPAEYAMYAFYSAILLLGISLILFLLGGGGAPGGR